MYLGKMNKLLKAIMTDLGRFKKRMRGLKATQKLLSKYKWRGDAFCFTTFILNFSFYTS